MTLRRKLIFAQAPLALALIFVGVVSGTVTKRLGEQSGHIIADNYRSVLAAERMKESLERIDSSALFLLAGHPAEASAEVATNRERFENELRVQENNITERGEKDVTRRLRGEWDDYMRALAAYQALPEREQRDAAYFAELHPRFGRIKTLEDELLGINQDAMIRKSERAALNARQFEALVISTVVLALALGLLASIWLTTRMLRPLRVVSAAVRRFGENDFKARAAVAGEDEIAAVAAEFNRMADRLERYRASSLGELLTAQQAA